MVRTAGRVRARYAPTWRACAWPVSVRGLSVEPCHSLCTLAWIWPWRTRRRVVVTSVERTAILFPVISVDAIRRGLARPHRGRTGTRRAAVAVVLHEGGPHPEMLFIERARRLGDPWSGHMAFPGGRVDRDDADERAAAERETLEEVGLDLRDAERLGRLDDLHAGVPLVSSLVLSAFVYRTERPLPLRTNHEVR